MRVRRLVLVHLPDRYTANNSHPTGGHPALTSISDPLLLPLLPPRPARLQLPRLRPRASTSRGKKSSGGCHPQFLLLSAAPDRPSGTQDRAIEEVPVTLLFGREQNHSGEGDHTGGRVKYSQTVRNKAAKWRERFLPRHSIGKGVSIFVGGSFVHVVLVRVAAEEGSR